MNPKFAKRFAVGVALGALVYLGFAIFADFDELSRVLAEFPWVWMIPVLGMSLINYFIRFSRWQFYLTESSISLDTGTSLRIFFAGLVMSVTPGKLGELLKAYLVRAHNGTAVSRTGPIVVAERVTDLVALSILIFIGALIYQTAWLTVFLAGTVSVVLVSALVSPRLAHWVLSLVRRIRFLEKYAERIDRAYESLRQLLKVRLFTRATLLATLAWFAECMGFFVVAHAFGIDISIAYATFVYAVATVVGALLLVPGGLGGTEATMVAMLMTLGASKEIAVAATFLTRVATLWFAVLLGALVLLVDRRLVVESEELGKT